MTNEKIIKIAMEQSAVDLNCAAEDFLSDKNKTVISKDNIGARKYLKLPFEMNIVSYGRNVVASVSQRLFERVGEYIEKHPFYRLFETPYINLLSEILREYSLKLCFMAEYFLPDMNELKERETEFETRILEKDDLEKLYDGRWENALCEERKELDEIGLGAYDAGELIALAGCSADCEDMMQIGIDVLPKYRRKGIGSALTANLALEIIRRGKVPFYCAAWSNIPSVRNAVKSGFRPSWIELTAKDADFADKLMER